MNIRDNTTHPGDPKCMVILNAHVLSQLAQSVQPALKKKRKRVVHRFRSKFQEIILASPSIHNGNHVWKFVSFSFSQVTEINDSSQRQSKIFFQTCDLSQILEKKTATISTEFIYSNISQKDKPQVIVKVTLLRMVDLN